MVLANYDEADPNYGSEFYANQDVIIYSASQGGWVPARIESTNADDSVTVKYATGHTKLVPLEFQVAHLRPADADCPPPEPTLMQLPPLDSLSPLGQIGQTPWQSSSQSNAGGVGQAPSGADNCFGALAPLRPMPRMNSFNAMGGQVHSAVASQANCQAPVTQTPTAKYSKNQEVDIYSEGSKAWVRAKITAVDAQGTVTVEYGGKQKLVPVESQHTHLRSVPGAATPASQQCSYLSAPVANQGAQQFAGANCASVPSPAKSNFQQFGGGNPASVLQPANAFPQQFGCANSASKAPPNQAGAFQFDLSALCNDAGMK